MKVFYRQTADEDVIRQFRYYLLTLELPEVALRFRDSVRDTVELLRKHPSIGPRYRSNNPRFPNLRSWPVKRFEAISSHYIAEKETLQIVRILHGKRDVKRIIETEEGQ